MTPRIGTAGWTIPKAHAAHFRDAGSHLERYAQRLNAAEINSSFHKPHRRATYERWAASVPEDFAFAAKLPKAITHAARLANAEAALDAFLEQASGLGDKLHVLLVQLPPSFAFDAPLADGFFAALRERTGKLIACEPRHATWFAPDADALLAAHKVARVAADPAVVPEAAQAGGWRGLTYMRLHGAPVIYRSTYEADAIARHAALIRGSKAPAWCIYDNTTFAAATANALALAGMLGDTAATSASRPTGRRARSRRS
jgi:uncharacterized protein YecE (DUF72 family)